MDQNTTDASYSLPIGTICASSYFESTSDTSFYMIFVNYNGNIFIFDDKMSTTINMFVP